MNGGISEMTKTAAIKNLSQDPFAECVLFDGECSLCKGYARRFNLTLKKRGIGLVPLQSAFAQDKLDGVSDPLKEMLLVTADKKVIGGADAFIYLSRKIWWAYGFYLLAHIPGVRFVYRRIYAHVACNRHR